MKRTNHLLSWTMILLMCLAMLQTGALAEESPAEEALFEEGVEEGNLEEENPQSETGNKSEQPEENKNTEVVSESEGEIIASGTCGANISWTLFENGVLCFSGNGDMSDFARRGSPWYQYRELILHVVVSEGITSIGNNAFIGCINLQKVDIADSVSRVGNCAFEECYSLMHIDIPKNIVNWGEGVFGGCGITSFIIPEGLTSIPKYAFSNCDNLVNIRIPQSVTHISDSAFYDCDSLQSIEIPGTIIDIDELAFSCCANIRDVYYGGSEDEWLPKAYRCSELSKATAHFYYGKTFSINYEWLWEDNEYSTTAIAVCDQDSTITITETVQATSETIKESTCSEEGVLQYTAVFEDDRFETQVRTESIPIKEHIPKSAIEENRQEATCEKEGCYDEVIFCSVCNKELSRTQRTIPAKGHTPGSTVEENQVVSTCGAAGSFDEVVYCATCGAELSRTKHIIPMTEHDYELTDCIWSEDHSTASIILSCKNDVSHILSVEAEVTDNVTETETTRIATYTAKAILNGKIYSSVERVTEQIQPELISLETAVITIPDQVYSGKAIEPSAEVTFEGEKLISGEDYDISYNNNLNAGTATVTVTGKGKYTGTSQGSFKITPKKITPKVILSTKAYTWNGKVKKPSVTVKNGSTSISTSNYTVTHAKGRKNVGKYAVKVTLKGNYSGSKTVYFKINPKGTTLATSTAASKAITVKWKKQSAKMASSRISGYQIQLATNSKFTKNKKTVTVPGYSKTSKRISGLKGKKKYYIRIRTYKTVSGTKYYSSWSKVKTITTKA